MAPTPQTAIDRKLHCIMLKSTSGAFAGPGELARSVQGDKNVEFSYARKGEIFYSGASTVQKYIRFAQAIAILDEDLKPTQKEAVFKPLNSFQNWLGSRVIQYLNTNGCSADQIKDAIRGLLQEETPRLPTPDNVFEKVQRPVSRENFMTSIKLVSLLRPKVFDLAGSRRIIHNDQIFKVE
jgi:hypothetical protein